MKIGNKKIPGAYWLVNHQCRPETDMLKHENARKQAIELLRITVRKRKTKVINYAVIPGQFIMLAAGNADAARKTVHDWAGAVSQVYAQKKQRNGPFWKRWYRMCLIQEGTSMKIASSYIDATAAKVTGSKDPAETGQTGYRELTGITKRYRIINQIYAAGVLNYQIPEQMHSQYIEDSEEWRDFSGMNTLNEAVAVGDKNFINIIADTQSARFSEIRQITTDIYVLLMPRKTAFRLTRSIE